MSRFFLSDEFKGGASCIYGQDAKHISQVLRKKCGDMIELVFKGGQVYAGVITSISPDKVIVEPKEQVKLNTEPPVKIILAQGLPKADKFELVIQKAVELGIHEIVGLELTNCVVRYDEQKKKARIDRWQKIAYEAAKQCGRTYVPPISGIYSLADFLQCVKHDDLILFYEKACNKSLKLVLENIRSPEVVLFVGPEGGFTAEEAEMLSQHGAKTAGLGPRILRTETAAITAISVVMYELGDIGGGQ